jgi:hypothetical protein
MQQFATTLFVATKALVATKTLVDDSRVQNYGRKRNETGH